MVAQDATRVTPDRTLPIDLPTVRDLPVTDTAAPTPLLWQQFIELTTILEWANLEKFERIWIEAQRARAYAELKCRADADAYVRQPKRKPSRRSLRVREVGRV